VQYFDFEVEFRNELNMLADSLLALEDDQEGDGEPRNSRDKFQSLVSGTIQRKEARTPIWGEWSHLDWKKKEDVDNNERFPCPLAATRFNLSRDLSKDLARTKVLLVLLSSDPVGQ
jgi:hypothetical protein